MFNICALDFIFSIDLFWKNMFLRLKGAATGFNFAYMQHEMAFLL